ncbi:unannotated protein [freshwater metagenome]|uniref:Unannotated protein n=1 Tax=freshwater metagenome TaxID=449393 RepID=A0A6J7K1S9_9ZZZZ
MPVLGKSFGHLDAETMHHEVFLVSVLFEQLRCDITHPLAHRDDVECGVVDLT